MIVLQRLLLSASVIGLAGAPALAQRLGAATGRVLSDADHKPVRDADVSIPRLGISTTSDSGGAFRLVGVLPGKQVVWVRRIGFNPVSAELTFVADDTLDAEFMLVPATTQLPEVQVRAAAPATGRLAEFEERRKQGLGRFLTGSQLEQMEGRSMSDALATVPGPTILRGKASTAWVVAGRGMATGLPGSGTLNREDLTLGARRGLCYAAVMLNGIFVYRGSDGERLFDINSIQPSEIAGVEVYVSASTIPARFNATGACGLVVLWTK